ncbi:MAG: energy-coupling factor transporter transmembrane protein EcfT [Ruminococcus sp.]|nr:energy-coupling factor transporter transmembrane protein EcfT [Ruminococcus sp.]
MTGLFSADTQNRGLVLDPRTKLAVMLSLVVFTLGGTGSHIQAVRYATVILSILPFAFHATAGRYKKAVVLLCLFALVKSAETWLVPQLTGVLLSIMSVLCMLFVRLMPSLSMGSYMLCSTTVSEFLAAMHRMHLPQQITIPLSVMFRFFPTVTEEFSSINTAMKMRDIRLRGKNAGKLIEYRLVPLMVCSVNIGSELSAAALTRGLGTKVKRTNICKIGFRLPDLLVIAGIAALFVLWILGMNGVVK